MFGNNDLSSLDDLAHIIQVALTPVFLLSAIAALLNVFSTRLGRVADQVDRAARELETADAKRTAFLNAQLAYLRRRSWILDIAVVLGATGGIETCSATLVLFIGALRDRAAGSVLFVLFAGGLLCTIGALAAFLAEMLMASRGLRLQSLERDHTHRRNH
jgi:hypothetical protein